MPRHDADPATATSAIVGGVVLTSSGAEDIAYATTDSNTGSVTLVSDGNIPTINYAKFENCTLTLKNAKIVGATKNYDGGFDRNVTIYAVGTLIRGDGSLDVSVSDYGTAVQEGILVAGK